MVDFNHRQETLISEHNNGHLENLYGNDPLTMLIKQERTEKIDKAIEALPGQCRKIFELVWHERLINKEIADRMGVTVGTVSKQINRAKTKILKSIGIMDK